MKNILISIFAMSFLLVSLNAQEKRSRHIKKEISGYQIGDKVDDFKLSDVEGKMTSLSDYKDAKGYIIVFSSNECPFVIANEERLIQIHKDMAPKGYPVIAINSNEGDGENLAAMKAKANEMKFPFAYLKDNSSVYQKFGATKTPQVFLLDQNRTLQYTGSIDDSPKSPEDVKEKYLVNAINALMNNQTPNPTTTKSIGCGIKRGGKAGGRGRKGPPSPEALLTQMDENKDMKISKEEAHGPLSENFDDLDTDNDGMLTADELSKMKPRKRRAKK